MPGAEGSRLGVTPQLVIFDCDGVLVDSEPISNGVLAGLLSAEGMPTTLTEARRAYQGLMLSEVPHPRRGGPRPSAARGLARQLRA
jgi:beta-phosphoglucomutase-like phosphatase (HAD superfamily)